VAPQQILVMGVSGAGKTVLAKALAVELGFAFLEGDDFHPPANIEKMRSGTPLTDADRIPWLGAIAEAVKARCEAGQSVVVACSALKKSYRDLLRANGCPMTIADLEAGAEILRPRLNHRPGHFMPASLLDSQLATLEPPSAAENALRLDAGAAIAANVAAVVAFLRAGKNR
jgi:carbohydrate kinase (thermoresistant glucokinase family)